MSEMHTPSPIHWQPELGIHTRLRETRIQYGVLTGNRYSQDAFAALLDGPDLKVSGASWRQWEAANNKPGDIRSLARRIEEVTGVPASWIIGSEPVPSPPTNGGNVVPFTTRRKVADKGLDVPNAQYIYTARAA